jgi:hypothetical protein
MPENFLFATGPSAGGGRGALWANTDRYDVIPFELVGAQTGTLAAGEVRWTTFLATRSMTVTGIMVVNGGTLGVGLTTVRAAVAQVTSDMLTARQVSMTTIARTGQSGTYFDGNAAGVAFTTANATVWQTGSTNQRRYVLNIADNGAATPAAITSVELVTGQWYAVGLFQAGATTNPVIPNLGFNTKFSMAPLSQVVATGQTDIQPTYTNLNPSTGGAMWAAAVGTTRPRPPARSPPQYNSSRWKIRTAPRRSIRMGSRGTSSEGWFPNGVPASSRRHRRRRHAIGPRCARG